jgi:hypothetical protein
MSRLRTQPVARAARWRTGVLAGISVLLAALVLGPGATFASAASPRLLTELSRAPFRVQPEVIGYTGDGTGFLGGRDGTDFNGFGALDWRIWNRHQAYARGVAWLNDCDPSCAEGSFHAHRARVRATRVRHGHYTRMKILFRWGRGTRTDRRVLQRAGRYWQWGIAF